MPAHTLADHLYGRDAAELAKRGIASRMEATYAEEQAELGIKSA